MWRPIEEAPKDGTRILGWEKSEGFYVIRYNPMARTCYLWQTSDGYPACPSHFMPLPAPPEID